MLRTLWACLHLCLLHWRFLASCRSFLPKAVVPSVPQLSLLVLYAEFQRFSFWAVFLNGFKLYIVSVGFVTLYYTLQSHYFCVQMFASVTDRWIPFFVFIFFHKIQSNEINGEWAGLGVDIPEIYILKISIRCMILFIKFHWWKNCLGDDFYTFYN